MLLSIVVGTRPEIIKMASIIKNLEDRSVGYQLIHTGQHYDKELSEIFFKELQLPKPGYYLNVGSGTQAEQTATAMVKLENTFIKTKPDFMLVEGDTNTVLAGALAAAKLRIKVGHVEAGLRSYDMRMPEEHNRRLTDHLSTLLFAPTQYAAKTLRKENVWGEIHVTGNTVIDACMEYMELAQKSSRIMKKLAFKDFILVTAHRAENVDNPRVLKNFVEIFSNSPLPIVYPIHPRTVKRLKQHNLYKKLLASKNVQLLQPVGYFDFLMLTKSCSFILTDSGGIQEEVTSPNIQKKVFVLRRSTERPEAVKSGFAEVVGTDTNNVLSRLKNFMGSSWKPKRCPFGKGDAGKKIVNIIVGKSERNDFFLPTQPIKDVVEKL